ncbi:hypothetical protein [Micromonospora wenchangensis]|uniref:hypothetical protein n=1 Tax=Micromonospora wenchangensis TaxID=1185415 RepID=UPI00380A7109
MTPAERATAALTVNDTFTPEQVAWLLNKALRIGDLTDPLLPAPAESQADPFFAAPGKSLPIDLAHRAGYAQGYADGENAAYAEMHADLMYAFGGPKATTMHDAINSHIRAISQRAARQAAADAQIEPYPLRLDDPDWPPVSVPGTIADPKALPSYWPTPRHLRAVA